MSPAPTKEPFAPSRDFLNYLACQPRNRANCRPHATNKFRFRETFSLLIPRWYRDNKTAFLLVHDYSHIFNGGKTILLRGNNSFKFVHYANYAKVLFLWNIIDITIEQRNSTDSNIHRMTSLPPFRYISNIIDKYFDRAIPIYFQKPFPIPSALWVLSETSSESIRGRKSKRKCVSV